MAKLLYLHGSSVGPYGPLTEWLEANGHVIVGRPRLPYPRHARLSWRWLAALLDRRWFWESVDVAQQAYDDWQPDLLVAVSMGGAVAMNLRSGDTPQVLIAPAWRGKRWVRFGKAAAVKPLTVILHGTRDSLVALEDNRRSLNASGPRNVNEADLVAALEEQLQQGRGQGYAVEGRLMAIPGEDHRCNGPAVRRALLTAIDVLTRPAACQRAREGGAT
jgi:hypothetical protein